LILTALLTLFVASCATSPRVSFTPPDTPPPVVFQSAVADKNDKTGELGVWLSMPDAKSILKERVVLRSIIDAYRAYWEKTQK